MFYPGGIARYGRVDISDQVMILDRAVVSPETSIKEKVMVAPITAVYEDTIQEEGTVLLGTPSLNLTRKAADVEMEITSEPLVGTILISVLSSAKISTVSLTNSYSPLLQNKGALAVAILHFHLFQVHCANPDAFSLLC
jgi:hypothetical protein